MKLLLDTHALLWWLDDDGGLGRRARDAIMDPDNDVLVSLASLWEVVVEIRVGKLRVDVGDLLESVRRGGFSFLDVGPAHLVTLARLPFHADHRDPFDHLLVAQAMTEGTVFVSEDRHAARYALQVLACSDA